MAYEHAGAYGRLYPVLMVSHDKRRRQLVRLPVLDPDGGEDTAEYVCFHRLFPVCLLHLREYAHAGLCLVPVLGGEDFLHLIIEAVLLADIHHAPDDLVMVDALHGIVVDVVLLVGTLQCLEVHHFDSVLLEVELLLSFQYCQCCFHNLEFYEVDTIRLFIIYCYRFPFSGMYLPSVERFQRDGEGPVRYSMIEQAAHDARPSVGITLRETERIRRVVVIEGYLTGMVGILLPAFQSVQTVPERGVADGFCIALYFLEMFFIQDFHDFCILSVKHARLREPVFLFLACLTVPCPYAQGLAKENTAAFRRG